MCKTGLKITAPRAAETVQLYDIAKADQLEEPFGCRCRHFVRQLVLIREKGAVALDEKADINSGIFRKLNIFRLGCFPFTKVRQITKARSQQTSHEVEKGCLCSCHVLCYSWCPARKSVHLPIVFVTIASPPYSSSSPDESSGSYRLADSRESQHPASLSPSTTPLVANNSSTEEAPAPRHIHLLSLGLSLYSDSAGEFERVSGRVSMLSL